MTDGDGDGDGAAVTIEQLVALRDGELPEDEQARLLERVADDPSAAKLLAQLRGTDVILARLRRQPIPSDVEDAITKTLGDLQHRRRDDHPGQDGP